MYTSIQHIFASVSGCLAVIGIHNNNNSYTVYHFSNTKKLFCDEFQSALSWLLAQGCRFLGYPKGLNAGVDHWSQKNFEFPENISQERIKL